MRQWPISKIITPACFNHSQLGNQKVLLNIKGRKTNTKIAHFAISHKNFNSELKKTPSKFWFYFAAGILLHPDCSAIKHTPTLAIYKRNLLQWRSERISILGKENIFYVFFAAINFGIRFEFFEFQNRHFLPREKSSFDALFWCL